jgi:hypothetical protein
MADKLIITPNDTEIEEVETIVVIRTPEQFAEAVMAVGDEFGKMHKNPHNDPFIPIRKRS